LLKINDEIIINNDMMLNIMEIKTVNLKEINFPKPPVQIPCLTNEGNIFYTFKDKLLPIYLDQEIYEGKVIECIVKTSRLSYYEQYFLIEDSVEAELILKETLYGEKIY